MGCNRTEGSSGIGDGEQDAMSLMLDTDGTHVRIFESSQLEDLYVGNLIYYPQIAWAPVLMCLTLPFLLPTPKYHVFCLCICAEADGGAGGSGGVQWRLCS